MLLSVIMLKVIMLNDAILSVVVPLRSWPERNAHKTSYDNPTILLKERAP
jgi:hypothetical protein